MYNRSYPKGSSSTSSYLRIPLLLKFLLLATVIGVCIASPVPSGGESDEGSTKDSSDISITSRGTFNTSEVPQIKRWFHRRDAKEKDKEKKKGFRAKIMSKFKKPFGRKDKEEEKETEEEESEDDQTVLGYSYQGGEGEERRKLHPSSIWSDQETSPRKRRWDRKTGPVYDKKSSNSIALGRLDAISVALQPLNFDYITYFPGPNYYNKIVTSVEPYYYQAKTMVSLSEVNKIDIVYIPHTVATDKQSLLDAAAMSWGRNMTIRTGSRPNFGNTIIIVALHVNSRYAMLIPNGVAHSLGLSDQVDDVHDMPAATWQDWEQVQALDLAKHENVKTFVYSS